MAATNSNKVRFGLDNVAIAPIKSDGTYDTPVKIPGAVKLTTNPQGDSSSFYADNVPYYTVVTNSGYEGELEMAIVPDEVLEMMGLTKRDENGAYYEDADQVPVPYALLFRVSGDKRNRLNVMYNCTSSRPSTENQTKEDSTNVATQTLSFAAIPKEIEGHKVTKLSIEPTEENKAVCDAFYDEVLVPKRPVPADAQGLSAAPDSVSEASTKAELEAYAAAHGIDLSGCANNADRLAAIRAAEAVE